MIALETDRLAIGYPAAGSTKASVVASDLSLELDYGEVVCLVGPNGAGKSTLLRTISGLQEPLGGRALIGGDDVRHLSLADRAKTIAVVLTERANVGLLSAEDLVALGRHPHTDWAGRMTDVDRRVVDWALRSVGATELRGRSVHELSDGERQKVMIARALAQEPSIIILDEPTAFLDLPRRVEIIGLLKELTRSTNRAVLLSTHDLDLAIRAADRLWLMSSAGTVHAGAPEDLVLSGELASVFQAEGICFDPVHGAFHIAQPRIGTVRLSGSGLAAVWTRRALNRAGFDVVDAAPDDMGSSSSSDDSGLLTVVVAGDGQKNRWRILSDSRERACNSMYEVVAEVTVMSRGHVPVCESEP